METYNIQVTNDELAIIGRALGELPFKVAANLFSNISQQVRKQEEEYAKQVEAASKANGGSSPQPNVREESWSSSERSKGV